MAYTEPAIITLVTTAASTMSVKFVIGPASATNSIWWRPLRIFLGSTGTGFAHAITGKPVSAPSAGRTIEPKGSMWGIGFSVSRPARRGGVVTEPQRDDAVADLVQYHRDDERDEPQDRDVVDLEHAFSGVSKRR